MPHPYTDKDLLYAATARCAKCDAGLAYPRDHDEARKYSAWMCSAVLRGDTTERDHDCLPWAFWKVREETSINSRSGLTTRPPGTIARTVGKAKCPKCEHTWQSEPYDAAGLSHHWYPGPCPGCGYAVGANLSSSSADGPSIEVRFTDVVLEA